MFIIKTSKYPIGIDLSDTSLKAVQLNGKKDKLFIQAINKISLPDGVIAEGEIQKPEVLAKSLNLLLDKPKFGVFSSKNIVANLPQTKSYIKIIEIDNGPNDISDSIENEIENHIPLALNEIFYDWQIVKKTKNKNIILIGAAPKNIINQYVDVFKRAKLSINAFETESIANARALLEEERPKFNKNDAASYGIIDIGAKRAAMAIYTKNTLVFTISMPISGQEVTEKISKILEITQDQAEKAKIICGLDETKAKGIINEVLSDNIKKLNNKISEALEFYANHYPEYETIKKIILTGGGAAIKKLDKLIEKSTSIEAEQGKIADNLIINDKIIDKIFIETHNLSNKIIKNSKNQNLSAKQNSILGYTTAIGLAMRNIYLDI
ncbi:pilus assembly protein PilM [Candidatus Parcubacteria bacterium]|nr:pilus assembly protein PilM [Candidatus Parcubacteria bacterium]